MITMPIRGALWLAPFLLLLVFSGITLAQPSYYGFAEALSTPSQCVDLTRNLSFGMRGTDVVELQQFLITQGYLAEGYTTGYFGNLTLSAVKAFQSANDIPATGYVGLLTRAAIQDATCAPTFPPRTVPSPSGGNGCSQDIMQCSDGSWARRTGTNCSFACPDSAPIPTPTPTQTTTSQAERDLQEQIRVLQERIRALLAPTTAPTPTPIPTPTPQTRLNLSPVLSADSCTGQYPPFAHFGATTISSITDPNNHLVTISKQALLSLGIGQQYLQDHFKFICAQDVEGNYSSHFVIWQYSIGDYAIELRDDFGFITKNGSRQYMSSFPNSLHALSEIQTVISKDAAADAMQACIGNFSDAHVGLAYPLSSYDYQTFNASTDYARPLLFASPAQNATVCPYVDRSSGAIGPPCLIKTATVDLMTGKCTKGPW